DSVPCLFCTIEHQPSSTDGNRCEVNQYFDLATHPVFVPATDDVVIERQLMTIFILRNVLQLPEDKCCEYLKEDDGQVGPDRWFSVCSSCIKTVEKCFAVERKVYQLQRQLEILKSTLRNAMHDTSAVKWNVQQPQNAICFDVRHYVTKGDGASPLELRKTQRELKILEQTAQYNTLEIESLAVSEKCLDDKDHMPVRVQNSRGKPTLADCVQCKSENPKRVRTQFKCKKCNVRLCIQRRGPSCYQKYHLQLKSVHCETYDFLLLQPPEIGNEMEFSTTVTDAEEGRQDFKNCAFHIPVRDLNERGAVTKSDCVHCKPHRSLTEFRCSHCHVSLCFQFGISCFEKYHLNSDSTVRSNQEDSNILSGGIKKTDNIVEEKIEMQSSTVSPVLSAAGDEVLSLSPASVSINSEDSDWHPSNEDIAEHDDYPEIVSQFSQSKRLRRGCRDVEANYHTDHKAAVTKPLNKKFVKRNHAKPTKPHDIVKQRMKKAQKGRNRDGWVLIKCEHCPAKYSETLLKSHRDLHSSGQGLACIKCGWYCRVDKIDYHMKWHLQDSVKTKRTRRRGNGRTYRYYYCDVCPANFKEKFCIEDHRQLHESGEGFECRICRWLFDSEDRLKRHMKAKHCFKNSDETPYYCDYCPYIMTSKSRAVNHFYTAHFGKSPLDCKSCSSKFESKQLLKMHRDQEHPEEKGSDVDEPATDNNIPLSCPHCSESSEIFPSKLKLDFHIASLHKDELLSCPTCKFKSKSYPEWVNHQNTHRKDPSFVCELCSESFRQAGTLWCHKRKEHYKELGQEAIICEECNRTFSNNSTLKNHIKAVHEKIKDYFCEYCGKGFSFNTDLQRHILLHTAPRELQYKKGPFTCEFCEAQFNVRQGLYYHLKRLHSDKFQFRCDKNSESVKMSSSVEVEIDDSKDNIKLESYPCICLFCATEHQPTNFAYFNGKLTRIKRDANIPSVFVSEHKESVIIVEHLRSMFILRHLFNLSEEVCCVLLKRVGGQLEPDLWFSVCSTCEETVQQCYTLRNKILALEKSLGNLKSHLCNLVRKSSWKNVEDGQDPFHINSICLDIRSHIIPGESSSSMPVTEESPDKLQKPNSTPARSSNPKRRGTIRKSVPTKTDNTSLHNPCTFGASTFPLPPNEEQSVIIEAEVEFPFMSSSQIVDSLEESLPSPASVAHDSDGSDWQPSENEDSLLEADLQNDEIVASTSRKRNSKRKRLSPAPSHSIGTELETDCNDNGVNENPKVCQTNKTKDEHSKKRKPPRPGPSKPVRKRRIKIRKRGTSCTTRKVASPSTTIIVSKCDACPATFVSTEYFERHRELHAIGAGESCSECGWLLSSKVQLAAHKRSLHSKDKAPWKTDKEEIPYYCDHCICIFVSRTKLIRHFHNAHHGLSLNECSTCALKLESKQLLEIHCQLEHAQELITSNRIVESLYPNNPSEKQILCSHCKETFSSKFKMDYHIAKCHKETLLWCTKCSYKAKKFCNLQTHLYKHTKETPFVCEICSRQFPRRGALQYHMRQDHFNELGVEPIKCKDCSLLFGTEVFLNKHIKAVHEKKKEQFCEYCGKEFLLTIDLKRHILLHTVPRELQYKKGPFTCEFCEAQFNVRQGLYYHLKKLHSDKFVLRCERCGKASPLICIMAAATKPFLQQTDQSEANGPIL
ncbi:putative zinc finger protein, partial [Orchesella cincta]